MFKGNWLVNMISACFAFIFVFSASFYTNLISTTLIRAAIAFIVFYLIAYLFRWLAYLASTNEEKSNSDLDSNEEIISKEEQEEQINELALENQEIKLSEEDVVKTSQFVKDLLEDEEG